MRQCSSEKFVVVLLLTGSMPLFTFLERECRGLPPADNFSTHKDETDDDNLCKLITFI